MTLKEFLDFISQSGRYFGGFLIVFIIAASFVYEMFDLLFRYFIYPLIKGLFNEKKEEKK